MIHEITTKEFAEMHNANHHYLSIYNENSEMNTDKAALFATYNIANALPAAAGFLAARKLMDNMHINPEQFESLFLPALGTPTEPDKEAIYHASKQVNINLAGFEQRLHQGYLPMITNITYDDETDKLTIYFNNGTAIVNSSRDKNARLTEDTIGERICTALAAFALGDSDILGEIIAKAAHTFLSDDKAAETDSSSNEQPNTVCNEYAQFKDFLKRSLNVDADALHYANWQKYSIADPDDPTKSKWDVVETSTSGRGNSVKITSKLFNGYEITVQRHPNGTKNTITFNDKDHVIVSCDSDGNPQEITICIDGMTLTMNGASLIASTDGKCDIIAEFASRLFKIAPSFREPLWYYLMNIDIASNFGFTIDDIAAALSDHINTDNPVYFIAHRLAYFYTAEKAKNPGFTEYHNPTMPIHYMLGTFHSMMNSIK